MTDWLFRDRAPRRSFARRMLSAVLRSLLALVIVVAVLLVSLFSFEQVTLRPLAEYAVERATGRAFRIEGELDAIPGRVVSLRAGRLSLANADWGSAGTMLFIDEVEATVDLAELLAGRYLLERVAVAGGHLLFEKNADGLSNWSLAKAGEPPSPAEETATPLVLPVRNGTLSDITVTVIDPALAHPLDIRIDKVGHRVGAGRVLHASLDARIGDHPVSVEAQVDASEATSTRAAIVFEAAAVVDATRLTAGGNIDNLLAPEQVALEVTLASPEISQVTDMIGLPALFVGQTRVEARLSPAAGQHRLELSGNLGDLKLDADARLEALDSIDGVTLELAAAAPNLAAVIKLPGLRGLPARAFEIDSKFALAGSRLTIEQTRVELGDIRLNAQGVMNRFPDPEDTELNLVFTGENYLDLMNLFEYAAPAGLKPGSFELRADLDYSSLARQTLNVDLKLADLSGKLNGEIAGYPSFEGTRIDYRLSGKDGRLLQQWLGRPVPIDGAYSLAGEFTRTGTGFDIGDSRLTLGDYRLDFSGKVGNEPLHGDTDLALRFEGPDLGKIAAWAGYDGFVPAGMVKIDAAARALNDGIQVDEFGVHFDRSRIRASGFVTLQPGIPGSRIELSVATEDIVALLPPEFHGYVNPGQPFAVTGSLATVDDHLEIDGLQSRLGAVNLEASGRVSMTRPLRDASFDVVAEGPDLAAVVPAQLIPYSLPAQPFTLDGGIGFDEAGLALDRFSAAIGSEKLRLTGSIPLDDPRQGLKLDLAASGSDIRLLVPAEINLQGIDAYPYEAAVELGLDNGILALRQLKFTSERGGISGDLSISIDDPRGFGQFDLAANGNDLASLLPALPVYTPPAEPFDIDARGAWSTERVTVDHAVLAIDNSRIEVQGEVGLQANQVTTGLVLSASGDSTDDLGKIEGVEIPDQAFQVEARFESDATRLLVPTLEAVVGDSELHGRFAYAFGEKPDIEIRLQSRLLNLAPYFDEEAETDEQPQPAVADGRMIPDLPVPVEQLNRWNLVVDINIDELRFQRRAFDNVEIDASLRDGDLRVTRLHAKGVKGAMRARFRATVEGDRIVTRGELEGKNVVLREGEAIEEGTIYPEQNIYLEFDTSGATSREMAANLNGFAEITGAEGRLNNNFALNVFGSFFGDLLSKINPFVTREPYTTISCFAAYADIEDGVATINPGAVLQTDKIDIFGRGKINLKTEKINLRFDTTARKGLGVSIGDFINPFVGVGGTLARPRLGVDPENAMFEGGVAFATGGVSIVLTNLYRSWFGSSKPCADFASKAEKLRAERRATQSSE